MNADETWKNWVVKWLLVLPLAAVLIVICTPIVLLCVSLWMLGSFLIRLLLLLIVWISWTPRGISMLIVYSNSPYWQDYFEKGLLPLVGHKCKTLNWSERKAWPLESTFRRGVFGLFRGEKEYNPLILFFRPFRWPTKLRFYQPFRDARHGKYGPLCDTENELAVWLNQPIDLKQYHPRQSV